LFFISGFCDQVKESSWIENGRKYFYAILQMEILEWMLLMNFTKRSRKARLISLLELFKNFGVNPR